MNRDQQSQIGLSLKVMVEQVAQQLEPCMRLVMSKVGEMSSTQATNLVARLMMVGGRITALRLFWAEARDTSALDCAGELKFFEEIGVFISSVNQALGKQA